MSTVGALFGLALTIFLIIKRISPVYSLILGALAGGLVGGMGLTGTVQNMISGVKDITPAIVRILAAGVLTGVLIKTGAASSISQAIIRRLGKKNVYLALALSTMLLTAIGVFVDVAVITVAPIALMTGRQLSLPKSKLLIAMIGGGKCGNIISPNPNTISAAENLGAPLSPVMFVNLIPAVIGLLAVVFLIVKLVPDDGIIPDANDTSTGSANSDLPSFWASICGPLVAIALLSLRPLFGITIDPLVSLPVGGIVGIIAMRKWKLTGESIAYGLEKMSVVAVILVGTGTIAGIIKASTLTTLVITALQQLHLGGVAIAPVAGILMAAATASTTAGATLASSSFGPSILASGVTPVWGAAMINSGATVLDQLPYGSFFHATGGSVGMAIKERLKLIKYEAAIGFVLTVGTVICYLVIR